MRIGIDVRAIGRKRTGDETYTLQLVRNLAKIDTKNTYFLYTDAEKASELEAIGGKIAISNDNFNLVSVLPSAKALWTFWSLSRRAKKDKLDVLHVQYISPIFLDSKIKLVTTIHDLSFLRLPGFIGFGDRIFLKFFIPFSMERADKVIAVSGFTKKEIVHFYSRDSHKAEVVYNGGAERKFFERATEKQRSELRKELGFEKPYILYLGTLQPRKNIPALLRGYASFFRQKKVDGRVLEHHLVVVGSRKGANYDRKIDKTFRSIVSRNGEIKSKIHFPGYIKGPLLPALFQEAELFCFPSLYEGFGLPLIEAMAGGTPIVSNSTSCLKEIGQEAVLFADFRNEGDIAACIEKILENEEMRNVLRKKGYQVANNFSWEKCAMQTLEIYKKLVYNR